MEGQKHSVPASTKFRFRDIGPIKNAEFELGDLTIIAGRNNTGKTYLVYTLYGLLKLWSRRFDLERSVHGKDATNAHFPDFAGVSDDLLREGRHSFPVRKEFTHSTTKHR